MNKVMHEFCKRKKVDPEWFTDITLKDLKRPITVLLGPNGTGKTFSMHNMKRELYNKDVEILSFKTSINELSRRPDLTGGWELSIENLACNFMSEGERLKYSFYTWLNNSVLKTILDTDKEIYIFIDELDSGLSLDKMKEVIDPLLFVIKQELNKKRKIHLIISANTFELAELFAEDYLIASYLWVPTKEFISLGAYSKYKKLYLEYYQEMNKNEN